jgi:hypothetical protein
VNDLQQVWLTPAQTAARKKLRAVFFPIYPAKKKSAHRVGFAATVSFAFHSGLVVELSLPFVFMRPENLLFIV